MDYFAYGSNLDPRQMAQRCPGSRFVCVAMLPDYRLAFTSWAARRGCGVADVIPAPGGAVWGAVYRMSESDWPHLDRAEGFIAPGAAGNRYQRTRRIVYRDGDPKQAMRCWLYEVCDKLEDPVPSSRHYKGQILYGARHWKLPEAYIRDLETIVCQESSSADEAAGS